MPRWSSTSMVRACSPPPREPSRSWLVRRSTMATSTPANASSPASINPAGPPPAMTTAWRSASGPPPETSSALVIAWPFCGLGMAEPAVGRSSAAPSPVGTRAYGSERNGRGRVGFDRSERRPSGHCWDARLRGNILSGQEMVVARSRAALRSEISLPRCAGSAVVLRAEHEASAVEQLVGSAICAEAMTKRRLGRRGRARRSSCFDAPHRHGSGSPPPRAAPFGHRHFDGSVRPWKFPASGRSIGAAAVRPRRSSRRPQYHPQRVCPAATIMSQFILDHGRAYDGATFR